MSSLEEIEERLHSPKWKIRLDAVKELEDCLDGTEKPDDRKKAIGLLVERLMDRSTRVVKGAIELLLPRVSETWMEFDYASAVPPLIENLGSNDKELQVNSLWLLGEIRHPLVLPILVNALEHSSEEVRFIAGLSFAKMRDPSWAPVLLELMGHISADVRGHVAEGLTKMARTHKDEIVRSIVEFLNSDGFKKEAERNTTGYARTIEGLDEVVRSAAVDPERGKRILDGIIRKIGADEGILSEGMIKPPKRKPETERKTFSRRSFR